MRAQGEISMDPGWSRKLEADDNSFIFIMKQD
jgi:hypothetical protein